MAVADEEATAPQEPRNEPLLDDLPFEDGRQGDESFDDGAQDDRPFDEAAENDVSIDDGAETDLPLGDSAWVRGEGASAVRRL